MNGDVLYLLLKKYVTLYLQFTSTETLSLYLAGVGEAWRKLELNVRLVASMQTPRPAGAGGEVSKLAELLPGSGLITLVDGA